MTSSNTNFDELDWVQLRKDMDEVALSPETFMEKAKRKFGAEPLIPIGCLLTTSALCFGLYSFKKGNTQMSQYMMRLRVMAQGFTIAAFVIGIGAAATASAKK